MACRSERATMVVRPAGGNISEAISLTFRPSTTLAGAALKDSTLILLIFGELRVVEESRKSAAGSNLTGANAIHQVI